VLGSAKPKEHQAGPNRDYAEIIILLGAFKNSE